MKKLMIPAIVALMSVGALAEDAAKPAEGAAAPAAAGGDCKDPPVDLFGCFPQGCTYRLDFARA